MSYWIFKSEPNTYPIDNLEKDNSTQWNGIRNYQARNNLKIIRKNDIVLIYHSGLERSVVGIAKVIKEAYPDNGSDNSGDWLQVDIQFVKKLNLPFTLAEMKKNKELSSMSLVKQSRLSICPITKHQYDLIVKK